MNTLSISQIFSNFTYYQEHYLSILNDDELYFTPVQDACLQLRFVKDKQLYLGDLLQLWFSEKWIYNFDTKMSLAQFFSKQLTQFDTNFYLFSIKGNAVTGRNVCKAWCVSEQKIIEIRLNAVLPYYCYFESITRPKNNVVQTKHSNAFV